MVLHHFIVTCVVPSLRYGGSNPLGLHCSSVLEFCKGMGFKEEVLPVYGLVILF